jgi:hypothetical protein
MKGFLNDIGATKFADNFEPIINKYYGNNIDAWDRLILREEVSAPRSELVNRLNRLVRRYRGTLNTQAEIDSFVDNTKKLTNGKSSKEIFSSPDGKLMKNIIKGETGGVGQPSIYFNNVKGRNKSANLSINYAAKKNNLTKDERKELLRKRRVTLRGNENFMSNAGNSGYGHVFISDANPSILSHELGHAKSTANSIAAGTTDIEKIDSPKKLRANLYIYTGKRADAIYDRLNKLSTIAEENMANAYGRDILRKYGGKNVDKYLADYEKMVDNVNMKDYLNRAKHEDAGLNLDITGRIIDKRYY